MFEQYLYIYINQYSIDLMIIVCPIKSVINVFNYIQITYPYHSNTLQLQSV